MTPQYDQNGRQFATAELLAMKAAGETWCETDSGGFHWPFCIIDGCTNRACLRLDSPRCWPHTLPGVPPHNAVVSGEGLSETVNGESNV